VDLCLDPWQVEDSQGCRVETRRNESDIRDVRIRQLADPGESHSFNVAALEIYHG